MQVPAEHTPPVMGLAAPGSELQLAGLARPQTPLVHVWHAASPGQSLRNRHSCAPSQGGRRSWAGVHTLQTRIYTRPDCPPPKPAPHHTHRAVVVGGLEAVHEAPGQLSGTAAGVRGAGGAGTGLAGLQRSGRRDFLG